MLSQLPSFTVAEWELRDNWISDGKPLLSGKGYLTEPKALRAKFRQMDTVERLTDMLDEIRQEAKALEQKGKMVSGNADQVKLLVAQHQQQAQQNQ